MITFPRELPSYHVSECWFDIVDNVTSSPSGKGTKINLSQVNDPVWQGTFATGLLYPGDLAIWSAWRKSLRAGLKTFLAYDVRRRTPIAYPTAKTPADIKAGWDGSAVITSLGLSGALGLSGLPANYQFKAGDRIGMTENANYGYHEVVEDILGNGAGIATVTVTPFLFTGIFSTAAVAQLWQPRCQFQIDPTTWVESGTVEPAPVTFKGYQRL
jgi:hypothetical protein